VRSVLEMEAKQRDSVKMAVTKVLTAWLLTARREPGFPRWISRSSTIPPPPCTC
jgi:hypothetical protein